MLDQEVIDRVKTAIEFAYEVHGDTEKTATIWQADLSALLARIEALQGERDALKAERDEAGFAATFYANGEAKWGAEAARLEALASQARGALDFYASEWLTMPTGSGETPPPTLALRDDHGSKARACLRALALPLGEQDPLPLENGTGGEGKVDG